MKIASVTACPITVPLKTPMNLRGGAAASFTNVLVCVRTTDGVSGYGEATPRPKLNGESVRSVLDLIENVVSPMLSGATFEGVRGLTTALGVIAANHGAKSAVEAAAWDVFGRESGVSCHRLLGGFTRQVRCSVLLSLGDPHDVVRVAERARERLGVRAFKVKVGTDLDRDVRTVQLLRAALPDAILMADANGGYSPREVMAFLCGTESEHVAMLEEPTSHPDAGVRRRITESTFVDMVGDESCTTVDQAAAALSSHTVSGVSIKVGRTGIAGSGRIRDRAEAAGARVQMGYELVTSIGAAASLAFAVGAASSSVHPTEGISFDQIAADPVMEPLRVAGGLLEVPADGVGMGVDIDSKTVRKLSVR